MLPSDVRDFAFASLSKDKEFMSDSIFFLKGRGAKRPQWTQFP